MALAPIVSQAYHKIFIGSSTYIGPVRFERFQRLAAEFPSCPTRLRSPDVVASKSMGDPGEHRPHLLLDRRSPFQSESEGLAPFVAPDPVFARLSQPTSFGRKPPCGRSTT